MIQIALQEENDDADKSEAADGQWHPKPMINSLSSHSIFCRSADSTRIKTISEIVPTRIGAPQVPAPSLVRTSSLPNRFSPRLNRP